VRNALITGLLLTALAGCASDDGPAPSPARVPGPAERNMTQGIAISKPLPEPSSEETPAPPFNDAPLVSQEAPETPRFVDTYSRVGHPRILVWVMHGAGANYDEAAARAIDYSAMQNILADWLSSGGRVAMISPNLAEQTLTPQQAQSLNDGHMSDARAISDRVKADVLVLVRAQPTRQSSTGTTIRLVADASNLAGGESIGRAVVDVPPPLDKPQMNTYTRFLARKLMLDMSNVWAATAPGDAPAAPAPAVH
jgi:hypothetical protein